MIITNIWKNKKCSKPPTSSRFRQWFSSKPCFQWILRWPVRPQSRSRFSPFSPGPNLAPALHQLSLNTRHLGAGPWNIPTSPSWDIIPSLVHTFHTPSFLGKPMVVLMSGFSTFHCEKMKWWCERMNGGWDIIYNLIGDVWKSMAI